MKVSQIDAKIRSLVLHRQNLKTKVANASAKIKDLQNMRRSFVAKALRKARAKAKCTKVGRRTAFEKQLCMRCVYNKVGKAGGEHIRRFCVETQAWLAKPGNLRKVKARYQS